MDFVIGAALLAAGIVLNRIFETFWPSKEAERQRKAEKDREEREARRKHRADLVQPIIEILDGVGITSQKRTVVNDFRKMYADEPERLEGRDKTLEEMMEALDREATMIGGQHARRILEDQLPLVSRVTDEATRKLLRDVLILSMGPHLIDEKELTAKVTQAHEALEDWASSVG